MRGIFQWALLICSSLLVVISSLFASMAMAASFYVPSQDSDGAFSISIYDVVQSAEILERVGSSGTWTSIKAVGPGNHQVPLTRGNGTYSYQLKACVVTGGPGGTKTTCPEYSIQSIVVNTFVPLPAPQISLTATDQDGVYFVAWNSVAGATFYKYQERIGNGSWSAEKTLNTNSVQIAGKSNGTYAYQVRACNESQCSSVSTVRSIQVTLGADAQTPASMTDIGFLPDVSDGEFVAVTEGNYEVDQGVASYQVPIQLPPAVNDLKPSIALTYRSQNSASGPMGVGWGVSGIGKIHFCMPSFATDGTEAQDSNPKVTLESRLCLNGMRLVLANGDNSNDAYWAEGAEYHTELDSFTKIVARDRYGFAPAYFQVYSKGGAISYYGREAKSQQSREYLKTHAADAIKSWALDHVQDRYGNAYQIYYHRQQATAEHYPKSIRYAPGASVVFVYDDKTTLIPNAITDVRSGYESGQFFFHSKILTAVQTYVGSGSGDTSGQMVQEYQIAYKRSSVTSRYLVDTITECGLNAGVKHCAESLQFGWEKGAVGYSKTATAFKTCAGEALDGDQLVDMDGDGYNDLIAGNAFAWGTADNCFNKVTNPFSGSAGAKLALPVQTASGKALALFSYDRYENGKPWVGVAVYQVKKARLLPKSLVKAITTKNPGWLWVISLPMGSAIS